MEDNNFEKKIQEKLMDLQIQPSEKAWAGIESRIGKKDSSKRSFWFILIGLFLLAGGGYIFLLNGNGNGQVSRVTKRTAETILQKEVINQKELFHTIPEISQGVNKEKEQVFAKSSARHNQDSSVSLTSNTYPQENFGGNLKNKIYPRGNKKMFLPADKPLDLVVSHETVAATDTIIEFYESDKRRTIENSIAAVIAETEEDPSAVNKILITDLLLQKQQSPNQTIEDKLLKEGPAIKKLPSAGGNKNKPSYSKNWEISITFSAAQAFLGKGLQLFSRQDDLNIAYDVPGFNSSPGRPGNSIELTPVGHASSPENSVGFKAGITLNKNISPNFSLVTGLGYTYYTNSILIGNQLPAGNFSSAGMLSPYRNNFHFVDLPVSASFNLNKGHKIPLNLALGLNASQLITSDAVQYKNSMYEVDNSMFNKTQVGINAGFSATFFGNLSIGPFLHYGLNPLAKEGLYEKKYLSFLGLKAEYIFKKNK